MASEVESTVQNGEVDMEEANASDLSEIKELEDPGKPIRLVNKAKRFHRSNSGGDASANGHAGVAALAKNSRKSRDGRGRGDPKKGQHIKTCTIAAKSSFLNNSKFQSK